jgi:hypothetical protein
MMMIGWILALTGLYWFATSFFLAKKSLSQYAATCQEAVDLLQNYLHLTPEECRFLQQTKILATSSATAAMPFSSSDASSDSDSDSSSSSSACWMHQRQVDALMIIVVDALRFDFALYNLPKSIGQRLTLLQTTTTTTIGQEQLQQQQQEDNVTTTSSDATSRRRGSNSLLLQFVADAPTVTMQGLDHGRVAHVCRHFLQFWWSQGGGRFVDSHAVIIVIVVTQRQPE